VGVQHTRLPCFADVRDLVASLVAEDILPQWEGVAVRVVAELREDQRERPGETDVARLRLPRTRVATMVLTRPTPIAEIAVT
jgi:hypothetical protein